MLPGATNVFNMAAKHEIEGIPLRAHHRQEVEFIHGYQLRGYIYIDVIRQTNKQIRGDQTLE